MASPTVLFWLQMFLIFFGAECSLIPCGRRPLNFMKNFRHTRIVGGEKAHKEEFPWTGSLLFNGMYSCGLTILQEEYVMTAAHCVFNYGPPSYSIKVGSGPLTFENIQHTVRQVSKIFIHPGFQMNSQLYKNDIAVLRLSGKLVYTPEILPICLPEILSFGDYHSYTGQLAIAVGRGLQLDLSNQNTSPNKGVRIFGPNATSLLKVSVPIISNDQCIQWYKEAGFGDIEVSPNQLCAGYKEGRKDACYGDSGGPLIWICPIKGVAEAVGVISAGIGCAKPLLPGIYTRVSSYMDWIKSVVA